MSFFVQRFVESCLFRISFYAVQRKCYMCQLQWYIIKQGQERKTQPVSLWFDKTTMIFIVWQNMEVQYAEN